MKRNRLAVAGLALSVVVMPGYAAAPGGSATSASEQTCRACHTLDTTKVGPPFRSIAERYKNDADAIAKLKKSMLEGSTGKWGTARMPPNAISEADADRFAHWVMSLNQGSRKGGGQTRANASTQTAQ